MAAFGKGDVVRSRVDAQGLKKGTAYFVVATDEVHTPFGGYTTYFVAEHVGSKSIPVVNGHLLLEPVRN